MKQFVEYFELRQMAYSQLCNSACNFESMKTEEWTNIIMIILKLGWISLNTGHYFHNKFNSAPSFQQQVAWLQSAVAGSSIAGLINIGQSYEGRDLWVLSVSMARIMLSNICDTLGIIHVNIVYKSSYALIIT